MLMLNSTELDYNATYRNRNYMHTQSISYTYTTYMLYIYADIIVSTSFQVVGYF